MVKVLDNVIWSLVRLMDLKTRIIYHGDDPYLARFYLHDERKEPGKPALYLHYFFKDDPDRALHNHPWSYAWTYILSGGYREIFQTTETAERQTRIVGPGSYNSLGQDHFHRVELLDGGCWSLFMPGPRASSWGFLDEDTREVVDWTEYLQGEQANPERYFQSGADELISIRQQAKKKWIADHSV